MIDYGTIANTSGTYPDVVSVNATGPGATDGTPYIKAVIDDLWGARQALMNAANLTPNATTESDSAGSQQLEAIQKVSGYPGEVVLWCGQDNPSGTFSNPSSEGIRLLHLTGQGVPRANYPDLDAAVYCGDAANPTAERFYRADDAGGTSRNIAGAFLILPDMQGKVARGFSPTGPDDPYYAESGFTTPREIGSSQGTAVWAHCHDVQWFNSVIPQYEDIIRNTTAVTTGANAIFVNAVGPSNEIFARAMNQTNCQYSFGFSEFESRMRNNAGRWCIRY